MTNQVDKLNTSLSHWRGVEPRPGFEDRVWRRIRSGPRSPVIRWLDAFGEWTVLQPAYAHAAALVIGAAVGLSVMATGFGPTAAHASDEFHILRTGSITGAYAQLTQGTQP